VKYTQVTFTSGLTPPVEVKALYGRVLILWERYKTLQWNILWSANGSGEGEEAFLELADERRLARAFLDGSIMS
jgi:hypothetical protein